MGRGHYDRRNDEELIQLEQGQTPGNVSGPYKKGSLRALSTGWGSQVQTKVYGGGVKDWWDRFLRGSSETRK